MLFEDDEALQTAAKKANEDLIDSGEEPTAVATVSTFMKRCVEDRLAAGSTPTHKEVESYVYNVLNSLLSIEIN